VKDTEKELAALAGQRFTRLVEIMARLRSPGGCPWDREQNFDTIKPYLLEETYEVLDAIDAKDFEALTDELGDLLLQAVFFAQMAAEAGRFSIADSVEAINRKLIRRHPHVFADGAAKTAEDVTRRWEEIKAAEKQAQGKAKPDGLLGGVPRSAPALVEARQIAARAAGVGFDWDNVGQVLEKLKEEIAELEAAQKGSTHAEVEDEIGDLLFVIVNIARFLNADPEQALRKTNAKFRRRFSHIEKGVAAAGKTLREASMQEMESLWRQAKRDGK